MKDFLRLYFKDYAAKILSVPLFFMTKGLQIILSIFSIVYGLLKIPLIGFCILGIAVELTSDPIRYHFVLIFVVTGICAVFFRQIEEHVFVLTQKCSERLKARILRPVQLKTNMKFTF